MPDPNEDDFGRLKGAAIRRCPHIPGVLWLLFLRVSAGLVTGGVLSAQDQLQAIANLKVNQIVKSPLCPRPGDLNGDDQIVTWAGAGQRYDKT